MDKHTRKLRKELKDLRKQLKKLDGFIQVTVSNIECYGPEDYEDLAMEGESLSSDASRAEKIADRIEGIVKFLGRGTVYRGEEE